MNIYTSRIVFDTLRHTYLLYLASVDDWTQFLYFCNAQECLGCIVPALTSHLVFHLVNPLSRNGAFIAFVDQMFPIFLSDGYYLTGEVATLRLPH